MAGLTVDLGSEVLRLLAARPHVKVTTATSTRAGGQELGDVLPRFRGVLDLVLQAVGTLEKAAVKSPGDRRKACGFVS